MIGAMLITSKEVHIPMLRFVRDVQAYTPLFKEILKSYLEANTPYVVKETKEGLELYEIIL